MWQVAIRLYDCEGTALLPSDGEVAVAAAAAAPSDAFTLANGTQWLGCFYGSAVFKGSVVGEAEGAESAEACCRRCRAMQAAANSSTGGGAGGSSGGARGPQPCNAWNWCSQTESNCT